MTRFALIALFTLHPVTVSAQAAPALEPLSAFGFRAGAPVTEVAAAVQEIDGGRLKCDQSAADSRVSECRATLTIPEVAEPLELWMSAIEGASGIVTIAGNFAPDELDLLRNDLERRYGRVGAKVQNDQWMMQWVRQGTMLRLTWRARQGAKAASISLVDGKVLDNWTARRGTPKGTKPKAAARKKPVAPVDTSSVTTVQGEYPR